MFVNRVFVYERCENVDLIEVSRIEFMIFVVFIFLFGIIFGFWYLDSNINSIYIISE